MDRLCFRCVFGLRSALPVWTPPILPWLFTVGSGTVRDNYTPVHLSDVYSKLFYDLITEHNYMDVGLDSFLLSGLYNQS